MYRDCNGNKLKVGDLVLLIRVSNLASKFLGKTAVILELDNRGILEEYGTDELVPCYDHAFLSDVLMWAKCKSLLKIGPDEVDFSSSKQKRKVSCVE